MMTLCPVKWLMSEQKPSSGKKNLYQSSVQHHTRVHTYAWTGVDAYACDDDDTWWYRGTTWIRQRDDRNRSETCCWCQSERKKTDPRRNCNVVTQQHQFVPTKNKIHYWIILELVSALRELEETTRTPSYCVDEENLLCYQYIKRMCVSGLNDSFQNCFSSHYALSVCY